MVGAPQHKVSGCSAVVAELVQHLEGSAIHHNDARAAEVGDVEESLLRIGRECHSGSRVTGTSGADERLREVAAVDCEHLDATIGTVSNIDQAIVGYFNGMNGVELVRTWACLHRSLGALKKTEAP